MSSTVLDILDARLKNCLTDYFSRISIKERLNILYVNIDMWQTYKIVVEKTFPNDAMDKIRLHVQKRFAEHKDVVI